MTSHLHKHNPRGRALLRACCPTSPSQELCGLHWTRCSYAAPAIAMPPPVDHTNIPRTEAAALYCPTDAHQMGTGTLVHARAHTHCTVAAPMAARQHHHANGRQSGTPNTHYQTRFFVCPCRHSRTSSDHIRVQGPTCALHILAKARRAHTVTISSPWAPWLQCPRHQLRCHLVVVKSRLCSSA